ncbi:GerAB/ArcD/ProY family transporter [Bacillus alkalisoli]|uniref:GerAB/ArcD/ProY family transporter n=1 Tax=Bacillus alkalisoli TaxID=2011008 RepID=UPI000C248B5A|nr:endospore germination permease [Bacillus alkalisoli]
MNKERIEKLDQYHVIFLVQNIMIGIGLLSLPNEVSVLGYNSWLVPIILGIIANILLVPIIILCSKFPQDHFLKIVEKVWGKWLGKLIQLIILLYGVIQVATVSHTYLRLVQSVILPHFTLFVTSILLFISLILIAQGGIVGIARFCIFSFFATIWMVFFLKWAFQTGDFVHLIPTFEVSWADWGLGIHQGFQSYFGFGLIAFFYPNIINKRKALLHASIGIWITVATYTVIVIASVVYFSKWQLNNLLFPILNLFQAVKLAFVERIEVFGTSLWVFLVLSTAAAYLWVAKKSLDSFISNHKNRTWHLYVVAFASWFLMNGPIPFPMQLLLFAEWSVFYGYILLLLPILLLITYYLRSMMKKRSGNQ